jgi:hypothetical protein
VLPTGALRRSGRLAVLPMRHAARTAAAASRLSRGRLTRSLPTPPSRCSPHLASLKGGAAKLGQAMSVFTWQAPTHC